MSSVKPTRIYLDMDGVMVGFDRAVLGLFGKDPDLAYQNPHWDMNDGLGKIIGIDEDAIWDRINQDGVKFWSTLTKLPWCDKLVESCNSTGLPLSILTTPSLHPTCLHGKLIWLQEYFGPAFRDYVFAPHKYLLARPDAILIDDRQKNITEWRERGGIGILFPASHNALNGWARNPIPHVTQRLREITKKDLS